MNKEPVRRRRGRPRASLIEPEADPRQTILDTAAHLFAAHGYAATGTREIAEKVGLRQASLFHYFTHKEDLLAELLERTVSPALAAAEWLDTAEAPPEVRLYLLARHDTENLCRWHDLAGLQLLPEARGPRFATFWAKRDDLRGRYRSLLERAERAGLLVELDLETLTDLVFGAVEATIMWYERASGLSAGEVADAVAASAVRGVLVRPPSAGRLQQAGSRLLRARGDLLGR
jgi:AcrR family transcriptional regulator